MDGELDARDPQPRHPDATTDVAIPKHTVHNGVIGRKRCSYTAEISMPYVAAGRMRPRAVRAPSEVREKATMREIAP